jgi:hypothetical protein
MTAIHSGSFVTRKGGDGTQMLVTSLSQGYTPPGETPTTQACCQWMKPGNELAIQHIDVTELDLQITESERHRFNADIALAELDQLKAEDAANSERIAALNASLLDEERIAREERAA